MGTLARNGLIYLLGKLLPTIIKNWVWNHYKSSVYDGTIIGLLKFLLTNAQNIDSTKIIMAIFLKLTLKFAKVCLLI